MGSTLTLRLPKSLHQKIRDLSKEDGTSINQFLVTAAAEKISAIMTKTYLENEAAKSQREHFKKVLKSVPHVEPQPYDRL